MASRLSARTCTHPLLLSQRRYAPLWGRNQFQLDKATRGVAFEETVEAVGQLIKEGKGERPELLYIIFFLLCK